MKYTTVEMSRKSAGRGTWDFYAARACDLTPGARVETRAQHPGLVIRRFTSPFSWGVGLYAIPLRAPDFLFFVLRGWGPALA